ncbi:unnamed protein product [Symbiodinium natans]|uniref:Uncharacterized protein n=1 Tax=Symbiodinium natans TaxID=878477 RepID=A0A812KIA0_9DINO|nr:unnamed protein product [Symbiodinium natans]
MSRFLIALIASAAPHCVWASNDTNEIDSNSSGTPGTCNVGANTTFTGCTGVVSAETTIQTSCPGNCVTESSTRTQYGCTQVTTTYHCVVAGVTDCTFLKTAFDTTLGTQSYTGYACEECSTTNCNPTEPLAATVAAVSTGGSSAQISGAFFFNIAQTVVLLLISRLLFRCT